MKECVAPVSYNADVLCPEIDIGTKIERSSFVKDSREIRTHGFRSHTLLPSVARHCLTLKQCDLPLGREADTRFVGSENRGRGEEVSVDFPELRPTSSASSDTSPMYGDMVS